MSTCKIYIKWKNVDDLWATIKQISAFDDYIRNGDCQNIEDDEETHFIEHGRDSCGNFGDINEVRPFRYSTNVGDCNNDDNNKKWACFIVNTAKLTNLPPPVFQSGTQEISPIFTNLTFSQDGKWSDISTTSDYLNMVAEYDATNINKLYVSQKVVGDSVTTYKIDINPIKTSLTNAPWSAISENSNWVDLVEFYIEFDNTQTQYLLEPECWGPNNPCDDEDDDDEDNDDEDNDDDTTKSNKASSTSFGVIFGFSIGGVLILFLVIMMARRAARRRLGMAPK